ncbi:D-Ala-D-Ala carboxypeptidase family metallohydrolase [Mesorhizobium sp. M0915]|uniref:D-Ala-D-Ala carboxypeptidase family metallohydrolase n=1 Tax=Mesorhizobium sp. M0915 TaxID=2957027 RepID=UPI00333CF474
MATIPLQIAERRLDTGNVVQYPQGGDIGRAVQSGGSDFTVVAERVRQRQDEMDKFKRISVENEFDQATANQAEQLARSGPADGSGLHDTIAGQVDPSGRVIKPGLFDDLAKQYRDRVPESQRGYFDASLPAKRLQLSGNAATAQYTQEQKYATIETGKIQDGLLNSILQMDPNDSASYESYKAKGHDAIVASPLSPLAKKAALDGWDQSAPKALAQAISARDPGKLRELFGMAPPAADPSLPAGMRNNNPGNIKFVGTGQAPGVVGPSVNKDQGDPQAVFNTPEAGMRAAYDLAVRKYDGGKTSANQLIAGDGGWTPGNTQAAANIAASMGLGADDDLNLKDPAQAKKFLRGLVLQEHGAASNRYSDAMISDAVSGTAPAAGKARSPADDLPILFGDTSGRVTAAPDMKGIHPDVIDRFKTLQNALGESLPVVSGFRDAARNERAGGAKASQHIEGNALDLDVRGKSQAERIKIIQEARAQGFGGIGIYANSIHIDTGPQRAWGASHHGDSLPMWARHALDSAPVGQAVARRANAPVDPRFVGMSPDDMLQLANQDDVAFRQKQAGDVAQAKVEYQAYKGHIELGIRTGEIRDPALILNSKLNEGDQASLFEMLKTENKDSAGVDAIISAIGAGQKVPVNGFDADQTKIADKAFQQFVAGVPEEKRGEAATAYVASTGYIPDQVQAQIRQGAASTDPQIFANAMSQANSLEGVAPISFNNFSGGDDVRKKLATYRHYVNDLGMSGEDAARRSIQMDDPSVKVNREALKPALEKFMKGVTVGDVTSAFDPGIFSSAPGAGIMPVQSQALLAEYREIAEEQFYETNGDEGAAKARALAELKTRWNVSNISGSPNLMRMPPELHYPQVNGAYDYLRADAMKTATGYAANLHRKVENVAILPDTRTRSDIELHHPPRYRLFYQYSENGQTRFDEVYSGPWGIDPQTLRTEVSASGERAKQHYLTTRSVNAQANAVERAGADAADKAMTDTVGPDWMKAQAAMAERERAKVDADTIRSNAGRAAADKARQESDDNYTGPETSFGSAM